MHQAIRERVAHHVRRIRVSRRLTQESVAHQAGLVVRHFQKIEAGEVNVTLGSLVKIAAALGVDVEELLRNDESGPRS